MDGRVVPRPSPRPAACLAGGRPGAAEGGSAARRRPGAHTLPSVREPLGPLSPALEARAVIRIASEEDLPLVRELWHEFNAEIADAPWRDPDEDEEFEVLERELPNGGVLLADEDGIAVVRTIGSRTAELYVVHVRPRARRGGVATSLVPEGARGAPGRGPGVVGVHGLAGD